MNNIRWVIQSNLISLKDLDAMRAACASLYIDVEEITVIPFSKALPTFTIDSKTNIYYGSTTLMYNIYKQLDKPKGLFFNEEAFSIENYLQHWHKYMLNSEAQITTFGAFSKQIHDDESLWFIRPDADDKSFSGDVKKFSDIKQWHSNFSVFENVQLSENTKIVVGPPYHIKKEWRTFIVDGKVVASSLYRKDFKLNTSANDKPETMVQFVEDRCREYVPHPIFVMDIALCGDTYYIIECGCMNSVGFYDADVNNIIKEISLYVQKHLSE